MISYLFFWSLRCHQFVDLLSYAPLSCPGTASGATTCTTFVAGGNGATLATSFSSGWRRSTRMNSQPQNRHVQEFKIYGVDVFSIRLDFQVS